MINWPHFLLTLPSVDPIPASRARFVTRSLDRGHAFSVRPDLEHRLRGGQIRLALCATPDLSEFAVCRGAGHPDSDCAGDACALADRAHSSYCGRRHTGTGRL